MVVILIVLCLVLFSILFNEFGGVVTEEWYEYDNNGNLVSQKSSQGYESNFKYDEMGKLIYENRDGSETTYVYDDKGNMISRKSGSHEAIWSYTYDEEGQVVAKIDDYGRHYFYEYDKKGNMSYSKMLRGEGVNPWEVVEQRLVYDENNNLLFHEHNPYHKVYYEYDERENLVYLKHSYGGDFEVWYEYNDKGQLMYERNSSDKEVWYQYDERGNMIYQKSSEGVQTWHDYDDSGNMIYLKRRVTRSYGKTNTMPTLWIFSYKF